VIPLGVGPNPLTLISSSSLFLDELVFVREKEKKKSLFRAKFIATLGIPFFKNGNNPKRRGTF